jgi:transcriptional regulator with XRE-family HTH domain/Zn-dependent peptidase ImmA (M78 family)
MTTNAEEHPWLHPGYSDVVAARNADGDLEVEFANGDVVRVPASTFGVSGSDFGVHVDPDEALSVVVTDSSADSRDISWTQLRSATDADFSLEMRQRDAEESRRLGLRLRALREDRNLNQRDLAALVGMSAPQLSKIESGAFDLRVSTVQTLLRAMGSTLADITGPDALEVSRRELRKRVQQAGVPDDVSDRVIAHTPRAAVVDVLGRAFGWTRGQLIAGVPQPHAVASPVRFRAVRKGDPHESPLVNLAYEVCRIVGDHAALAPYRGLPTDPAELRPGALDASGQVSLASLLDWTWAAGIPVLPLYGRGAFAASAWTVANVAAVVLKETRELAVFWLFDLAHELGHIARGHLAGGGMVDVESLQLDAADSDADEREANDFALQLLLPGYQELLHAVQREARGNYLRFKGAVATVARRANVSAGVLGMVAAYELKEIGQYKDRWGSASNLARPDGIGRAIVQESARRYLALDGLSETEAIILNSLVLSPNEGGR